MDLRPAVVQERFLNLWYLATGLSFSWFRLKDRNIGPVIYDKQYGTGHSFYQWPTLQLKTDLDDLLQNQNPKSFWYSVIYEVNQKQRIH